MVFEPVDLIIRVLLVLALGAVVVMALGRRSASLRALVWTLALGSALILPLLSQLLPRVPVTIMEAEIAPPAQQVEPSQTISSGFEVPAGEVIPAANGAAPGVSPPIESESPTQATTTPLPWRGLGMAVWGLGFLLILGRLLLSHLSLRSIIRSSLHPEDSTWNDLADQVRRELGIRRLVSLRISHGVQVPAVAAVFRPVLLLPVESESWTAVERRDVLRHEMAHIARWDALAQLVGHLCCAGYWFLPLAWWGARHAATLRERACDDVVLSAGARASAYARNLLNLARQAAGAELEPAALAMARPSRIEERVMGILDPRARRDRVTRRAAVAAFLLAGGIIGGLAVVEPVRASAIVVIEENPPFPETAPPTPIAAERPPVLPSLPAQRASAPDVVARDTNLFCSRGVKSSSNSMHEDGDERLWTVKVEGTDCKVDMRVVGRVEFNDDFTDIKSISRGGYFRLDSEDRGTRRELDIRPDGGSLTRVYKVNGTERPFDAEARAWFGEFLIALDRTTAVAVDIRLPRLLERGGPNAVLDETALMPSDYARGRYYTGLLDKTRLSSDQLTRLLDQAASLTRSDYYASELLKRIGREGLDDPAERQAVLKMLRNMDSDHYRAEVMKSIIDAGRPGEAEMNVLLEVVGLMKSDYYQSEVLQRLLDSGEVSAGQRARVARAAGSMASAHYASEVLKNLVNKGELSEVERAPFFAALDRVNNDYQKSEILKVLLRDHSPTADEIELILKSSQGVTSDHYRSEILGALLAGSTLREAQLVSVVTSVRSLGSDHYKNEILRSVLRNPGSTDRVRQAVVDAAETMSRYHRDEVRRAAGRI